MFHATSLIYQVQCALFVSIFVGFVVQSSLSRLYGESCSPLTSDHDNVSITFPLVHPFVKCHDGYVVIISQVGSCLSMFVAPLEVQDFVFPALSLIVTLHVPLCSFIVQLHHQVLIQDMLSVLHANVAVTDPLVNCVNSGLYDQVPHTGSDLSNL